jgi:hypothetical protein
LSFGLLEWGILLRSSRKERESEKRRCGEAHDGDFGWSRRDKGGCGGRGRCCANRLQSSLLIDATDDKADGSLKHKIGGTNVKEGIMYEYDEEQQKLQEV